MLGVGLTLVYGLGGVLNLAYGEFAILGAIVASHLTAGGASNAVAAVLCVAAAAGAGVLLDFTLMRPVYRQKGEHRTLLSLLLTLGLAFLLEGLLTWRDPLGAYYINITTKPVVIFGVQMGFGSILASAIAIAAGALLLAVLSATTFGKGVRSVIQDEIGAQLIGISPRTMRAVIFAVSGALAGLVAVTNALTAPLTVTDGFNLTIYALIVSVIGGSRQCRRRIRGGCAPRNHRLGERLLHRRVHH